MKKYIENFNKYNYLLGELVKKDIKLKYRRSKLGILWTLIEPILTTIVLTIVFTKLKGKTGKDYPFSVYILTGRLLYSFFSGSTKAAAKSIRANSGMIKKVYVPKYIYPLSSILSNYVIFMISMVVLVGAMIVFRVKLTIYILGAIIPLITLLVMALGVGMFLSTIAVFFRDVEYLWGVALTLIMYMSAIFYEPSQVADVEWIFKWNPLYCIIVNFRQAVLFGEPMDMFAMIYSAVFAVAFLFIGVFTFYKKQDEFILNI